MSRNLKGDAMTPEVLAIVSFVTGIIVSVIAIGLSVVFFIYGKKAEVVAATTLVDIKTNVDQLSTLNNDILKRAMNALAQSNKHSTELARVAMTTLAPQQATPNTDATVSLTTRTPEKNPDSRSSGATQNKITGHGLRFLTDPLTEENIKRQYAEILMGLMKSMGWVNNYGQVALFHWAMTNSVEPNTPLHVETIASIESSAKSYKELKEELENISKEDSNYYGASNVGNAFKNTSARLDALIRDYQEFLEAYNLDEDLNKKVSAT
jgi:hypothetical protein